MLQESVQILTWQSFPFSDPAIFYSVQLKKKNIYIERENQLFFPMLIVRGFKKIKQKRSIFALSTKALIMRELLVYDKYWLDKFKSKKAKATKCLWVS